MKIKRGWVVCLSVIALFVFGCDGDDGQPAAPPPNILLVIMDDVGIDQMQVFGYGGETPPSTPNIDRIADGGVRFHNAWSMPACSTSRAVIFDGRFPLRTNVLGALGPDDLANSQVSPYEMTVPKLLAQKGYESGLFGKFHLGLQEHNPAGYAMPYDLGWNYFVGWLDETGDPSSIDTTAGGVATPPRKYSCGFVPSAAMNGADIGACYMPDLTCSVLTTSRSVPPGRTCRDRGGILDPHKACQDPPPSYLNFETLSGHYVSPLYINNPDGSVVHIPPTDIRARRFRAAADVDAAVAWINERPAGRPWMATVSFASAHTPLMQPPVGELGFDAGSDLDCAEPGAQRVISNMMIESLDYEVGRLLVGTGLAQRDDQGNLVYDPENTDTMVIIVGDNGSLGSTVKVPFDQSRAKGTAYQTGVWVPLSVTGPLVVGPDREVKHMVNIADLFELFGEIAGINVEQAVPRPIDSAPLLPYLVDPNRPAIRTWNFTQVGPNLQANGAINGPCTISSTCTQIPVTKSVCEDNNGIWWGVGATDPMVPPAGFTYCCQVNAYLAGLDPPQPAYGLAPLWSLAIRNARYKIVENTTPVCSSPQEQPVDATTIEFYEINEDVPLPRIDRAQDNLLVNPLTPEQQRNFDELAAQLAALEASNVPCPGDGNIDLVVNEKDLDDWASYTGSYGLSSVYDLNLDGLTNDHDRRVIVENLGLDCGA